MAGAGAIASAEAFGTATARFGVTLSAVSIASAESFGSPTVSGTWAGSSVTGAGAIGSAEAFGYPACTAEYEASIFVGSSRARIGLVSASPIVLRIGSPTQ